MTKLLDSAFQEAQSLSQVEQNIFARFIIDEIHSEKKWDETFAQSEELLSAMADDALSEFDSHKTESLSIDKL